MQQANSVKQYFARQAQLAQKASECKVFTPAARAEYARIAEQFNRKAAACL